MGSTNSGRADVGGGDSGRAGGYDDDAGEGGGQSSDHDWEPDDNGGGDDDGDDDWDESEEEDGANVGQVNAYNRFRHPELWTSEEIRKLIRINKAEFEGFCAMTTPVTLHSTVLSHPSRAFLFQFRVCQDASKEVLGALYRAVLNLKHFLCWLSTSLEIFGN